MTSRIAHPRHLVARVAGGVAAVLAVCGGVSLPAAAANPPDAAATRTRVVDPAVRPAGGAGCKACGPAGCRHAHHAGCRDGVCVPYCPVRPQQFGYYGTRWRKWPGQQIVQVSGEQPSAPAEPPRSEVPSADEESIPSRSIEPPLTDAEETLGLPPAEAAPSPERPLPPASPREPRPLPRSPVTEPAAPIAPEPARGLPLEPRPSEPAVEPQPAVEPEPSQPAVEPEPEPREPAAPPQKPEPEVERPEEENLFEVLSGSGWRARRQFAVGAAAGPGQAAAAAGGVLPTGHARPVAEARVPPVPFDPAAETRRLRAAR